MQSACEWQLMTANVTSLEENLNSWRRLAKVKSLHSQSSSSSHLDVVFERIRESDDFTLDVEWTANWGASCCQAGSRENQDGWAVVSSSDLGMYTGHWDNQTMEVPILPMTNQSPKGASKFFSQILEVLSPCRSPPACEYILNSALPTPPASVNSHCHSKLPVKIGLSSPWSFCVFDGHGAGGKRAADMAAQSFASFMSEATKKFPTCGKQITPAHLPAGPATVAMQYAYDSMALAFRKAHLEVIKLNRKSQRDFGTTCVAASILGRYIVVASCGDSSTFLVASDCPKGSYFRVIKLNEEHSLSNKSEVARIVRDQRGSIVPGDGNVRRLIPQNMSYGIAKQQGLSINMSRALGHSTMTDCGLSPLPDFFALDLLSVSQVFRCLNRSPQSLIGAYAHLNLRPLPTRPLDSSLERPPPALIEDTSKCRRCCRQNSEDLSTAATSTDTNLPIDWSSPRLSSDDDDLMRKLPKFLFLVLASDGVTDACHPDRLAALFTQWSRREPAEIARRLTCEAEKLRSAHEIRPDNCTAVVVRLFGPSEVHLI